MEHWREFNYDVNDVLVMAMMHKAIKEYVNKRIGDLDKGPETMMREPNKDERQVLGRENYLKK